MTRHHKGYAAYARNDRTPRHKAVKSWQDEMGRWFCMCSYQVSA